MNELIHTLQIIREAIRSRNPNKASDAVTIFLMQFVQEFGRSSPYVLESLPLLKDLKDNLAAENLEQAETTVLALLARLMQIERSPRSTTIH